MDRAAAVPREVPSPSPVSRRCDSFGQWCIASPNPNRVVGCLTRIGCAVVLVAGGAAGYWLYGDRLPAVLSRAARGAADKVTDAAVRASERIDPEDGARIAAEQDSRRRAARRQRDRELGWITIDAVAPVAPVADPLAALRRRSGPAYVALDAKQVAGVLDPLVAQLPPSAVTAQVALADDRLLLRTAVSLSDFTGQSAIGVLLGKALVGEDTLFMAGTLEPVRPGLAQFRVRELRLEGIEVPSRLIPGVVRNLRAVSAGRAERAATERPARRVVESGAVPAGLLADDALPVPLPAVVSDARVVNGRLTLYRAPAATTSRP